MILGAHLDIPRELSPGMVAICVYEVVRCRVCGGRDCLGAIGLPCNCLPTSSAGASSHEALDDGSASPAPSLRVPP